MREGKMIARVARFEGVNVQGAERTASEAESLIRPMIENQARDRGLRDQGSWAVYRASIAPWHREAAAFSGAPS
jgi:hypothetical protein